MMGSAQLADVFRRLANPSWLAAYVRSRRSAHGRRAALQRGEKLFSVSDFPEYVQSQAAAIREITDASQERYEAAVASAWRPDRPEPDDETAWESRTILLEILAVVVALTRPTVAVEVGVERGYSSAVLLAGMASGGGRLYSIDLPRLREDTGDFVGRVVPLALRDRWDLTLGPSRQVLPEVLQRAGKADLFLHDGDHSYESQREDLEVAWPHLRRGGLVIVDDVWTPALIDFGGHVGVDPIVVRRCGDHDAVGLMRKPRAG
jgi:predicted O-methyltransferase YrrM